MEGCSRHLFWPREKVYLHLRIIYKKIKSEKQITIEEGGTSSWTTGRSSESSFSVTNDTSGDEWVPDEDLTKSTTELWRKKDSFSFRISS